MRSPCYECRAVGQEGDKNSDECMRCDRRIAYVAALEGRTCSMPVEMTDMARRTKEQTAHDDQFMRDHQDMPAAEIAKALGRSPAAISVRRSVLGLTRGKQHRATIPSGEITSNTMQPLKVILPALFKGHDDLYEQLKLRAAAEFRTPEDQVRWYVSQAIKGGPVDH